MQKIYIKTVDGTSSLEPMNAIEIGAEIFQVLPDSDFDFSDTSVLYEYHPGDIVGVEDQFMEEHQYTAISLIALSEHPQRKYWHFIFQATNYFMNLPPDEYQAEILQIKTEIANGTFHYRGVKAYLKYVV
jgi:hypothetical protein